ncbi:hypothetical protein HDU93_002095 [Gonapodya sp. JEL0774]|nr:hypothetical protein HDU93_002095 [Gonapodya sp. JEL0774]
MIELNLHLVLHTTFLGTVTDIYATGKALTSAGVVPGADMTPECALAKLSYLLSKSVEEGGNLTVEDIRHLIRIPLRGELTPPVDHRHHIPPSLSESRATFSGRLLSALTSSSDTRLDGSPDDDLALHESPSVAASQAKLYAAAAAALPTAQSTAPLSLSTLVPLLACRAAGSMDAHDLAHLAAHHDLPRHANRAPWDGRTALHVASGVGAAECVQVLLENGAGVYVRDRWGRTPLGEAVEGFLFGGVGGYGGGYASMAASKADGEDGPDWEGCVGLLRRAGAHFVGGTMSARSVQVPAVGVEGKHVSEMVWRAASIGSVAGLKLLIECGADPSVADEYGQTALHLAARNGHVEAVQYLVDLGRRKAVDVPVDNFRVSEVTPPSAASPASTIVVPHATALTPLRVPSPVARLQGKTPPPPTLPPPVPLDLSSKDRMGNTPYDCVKRGLLEAQETGDESLSNRFEICKRSLESHT